MISPGFLAVFLFGMCCSAQQAQPRSYDFSGDFRLRSEYDTNRDGAIKDRFRERFRLRFEAEYQANDLFTVGARLVTGDPDDPNSTHQTIGTVFNGASFSLDRAYVIFRRKDFPLWVKGGKFSHPFKTPAVYKEIVWDADVQPEGVAGGYNFDWLHMKVGIIGADYLVLQRDNDVNAIATAAQAFIEVSNNPFSFLGAVGAYRYRNLRKDEIVFRDNAGNAGDTQFRSGFAVIDAFFNLGLKGWLWPVVLNVQFIKNVEAAIEEDTGFAVGAAIGETKNQGAFKFYYQYQLVGQDAVFSPFSQDDFPTQTNFEGHVLGLTYRLFEQTDLNLWGLLTKQDSPPGENLQTRLRADLNISF